MVGTLTHSTNAIFWTPQNTPQHPAPVGDARYAQFAPAFADCDVVIVAGDTQSSGPKYEVWRSCRRVPPIASVEAVITDDPVDGSWRRIPRSDVTLLADEVVVRCQHTD